MPANDLSRIEALLDEYGIECFRRGLRGTQSFVVTPRELELYQAIHAAIAEIVEERDRLLRLLTEVHGAIVQSIRNNEGMNNVKYDSIGAAVRRTVEAAKEAKHG